MCVRERERECRSACVWGFGYCAGLLTVMCRFTDCNVWVVQTCWLWCVCVWRCECVCVDVSVCVHVSVCVCVWRCGYCPGLLDCDVYVVQVCWFRFADCDVCIVQVRSDGLLLGHVPRRASQVCPAPGLPAGLLHRPWPIHLNPRHHWLHAQIFVHTVTSTYQTPSQLLWSIVTQDCSNV